MTRRQIIAAAGVGAALGAVPAAAKTMVRQRSAGASSPLDTHDALGLADLVRRRQISATELLDMAVARARALQPTLNFMAQDLEGYARHRIKNGVGTGMFAGVPWLIKDLNTHIAGERTGQGSRLYADYKADVTSELVRRYEAAGLVIFGKTTTPEFGLTATTESIATGSTRNPWNVAHSSGGSSGGAAAAVAAGVIPAAHATDGGGSIRIPASCCGLFGLKPSRGRVPMGPLRTEGWGGLSTHHVVTRSVRDSAALLDVTHGQEPGSRYVAPSPPPRGFLAALAQRSKGLRIALMTTPLSGSPVDPECVAAVEETAHLCIRLGHHIEVAAPKLDVAAMGFAQFVLMGGALAADLEDRGKALGVPLDTQVVEPITLAFVETARNFTARDYARANAIMQTAALAMANFMTNYDMILSPTLAAPPIALGQIGLSPGVDFQTWGRRTSTYTPFAALANSTGQPSMSVPLSMSKSGLPIGSMFTGRYGEEVLLLRLAAQLEQAAPWAHRRPTLA